ncbi:hypothetical protein M3Y97_00792300 [Aphelenchoides bicaudatus]|nr:hypothetical protein M3Y97_00792300 [Aphelenchoides bicaudatus]
MNPYYKKKRKQIFRPFFSSTNSRSQNPESNNEANGTDASTSTSESTTSTKLAVIEQRSASPQPSTSAAANLPNNAEKPKKRLPFSVDALLIDSDVPKKKLSLKHSPTKSTQTSTSNGSTLSERRHASQPPTLQKQVNLNNPVNALSANQALPMSPIERMIQQFGINNSVKKPNASNTASQKRQPMTKQPIPQNGTFARNPTFMQPNNNSGAQSVTSVDSGYSSMSSNISLAGLQNQVPLNLAQLTQQQLLQIMSAQQTPYILQNGQLQQCPQLFQTHPTQTPVALTNQNIQQMLFNFSTLNQQNQIQQINAAQLAQALSLMNSVNPIQNVPIFQQPVPFVQIANTSRKHSLNGCSVAQQPQSSQPTIKSAIKEIRSIYLFFLAIPANSQHFAAERRPLHQINHTPTQHINAPAQIPQQSTSNAPIPSSTNANVSQHSPSEPPSDPEQQTEEQLICEWAGCMQQFEDFELYLAHVSRHTQAQTDNTCRWNNCERSLKPFAAHYMLVLHIRKHTKEKPHVCPFEGCDKSYSRLENLKTHFRTHSGERPYQCGHCLKCFSNASDRAKHQNRTHSNEKPYACPVENCDKSYTDPSSLRKHIKTQHGDDVYDVAKENKTKNGRGGNYGFIPANQVSKNPSSNADASNFPSTSRASTYQSTSNATSPLENSPTNSSPNPQSNDSTRQSNEGNESNVVNERALSTSHWTHFASQFEKVNFSPLPLLNTSYSPKDLLELETHKLETDFSKLMPVDRSINEFVDEENGLISVQVRACLQPIQNIFQDNVCSNSNGMSSDQFDTPNCADNLHSTCQLKNFEIKKEPKCSQCVDRQECDCKILKMPPSANK